MEEKSMEEVIFEVKETIKQIIVQSKLSPSILEMITRDIYLDVKSLSEQNLMRILSQKKAEEDKKDG